MLKPSNVPATVTIAVVVSVLVLGQIVTAGHAAATLDADVDVIEQRCEADAVTDLTLRIDVESAPSSGATAHVWSSRQHVQFSWEPSGIRLHNGTQTVTISAPDERAHLKGDRGQVWLAVGQRRVLENIEVRSCS